MTGGSPLGEHLAAGSRAGSRAGSSADSRAGSSAAATSTAEDHSGRTEPTAPHRTVRPGVETPRLRTTLGRWRFWIIVVVAVIVAAVAINALTGGGRAPGQQFGLSNPAEQGSMAVAEVLRDHGVTIRHATSFAELSADVVPDTTIVVVDPNDVLSYADHKTLSGLARAADRLVLFQPTQTVLAAVAPTIAAAGAAENVESTAAGCALPAAQRAATITPTGRTYRVIGSAAPSGGSDLPQLCFRSYSDAYSVVADGTVDHPVTVLGATEVITNGGIINQGNAALALGLLGTSSNLIWYEPSAADYSDDNSAPPPLSELAPGWITPVALLAAVVAIAAMVWRGRRLGALVVERLPVTVRARETMEGRARLYSRSGARSRALDALRIGTIRRLVVTLGLPSNATVPEVCRAVAAVTGDQEQNVAATLIGDVPHSDAELLRLSARLTELEATVANRTKL